MLVRDDFPELSTDLVTALATLDVNDFSHLILEKTFYIITLTKRVSFYSSITIQTVV